MTCLLQPGLLHVRTIVISIHKYLVNYAPINVKPLGGGGGGKEDGQRRGI